MIRWVAAVHAGMQSNATVMCCKKKEEKNYNEAFS